LRRGAIQQRLIDALGEPKSFYHRGHGGKAKTTEGTEEMPGFLCVLHELFSGAKRLFCEWRHGGINPPLLFRLELVFVLVLVGEQFHILPMRPGFIGVGEADPLIEGRMSVKPELDDRIGGRVG
jgi:hypothetical protein